MERERERERKRVRERRREKNAERNGERKRAQRPPGPSNTRVKHMVAGPKLPESA